MGFTPGASTGVAPGQLFTGQLLGGGGQVNTLFTTVQGRVAELALGSTAAPDTTIGPAIKGERYMELLHSQVSGAGPEESSAVYGIAVGDPNCQVQPVGLLGVSEQNGTGDALGVQGLGRQIGATGGAAIGGFFNGRAEATSSGKANGVQIDVENYTAEDLGATNAISKTLMNWMKSSAGTYNHSTGPYTFGAFEVAGGGPGNGTATPSCGVTSGSPVVTCATAGSGSVVQGANLTGAGGNQGLLPPGNYIASVDPGVSFTMANLLGNSPNANGTATATLFIGGGPQANYGWLAINSNPVITSTFADFGNSINSVAIEGQHTTALYAAAGAGPVVLGGRAPAFNTTLLEIQTPANQSLRPVLSIASPTSNTLAMRIGNSAGNADLFVAASANNILTGTAAGDVGMVPTTTFHIGGTKSIVKVTVGNALGFYNAGAVAQPAAYTLNAGTTSRNLPSGATLAQIESFVRQMAADLSASNGGNGLVA